MTDIVSVRSERMAWWLAAAVIPCLLKWILLSVMITMVLSTRSECDRTRFEGICRETQETLNYLPNERVKSMPSIDCPSRRWFHSPDGGPDYTLIDSSSSKYLIQDENLSLNFSGNVNASDEGIYGCLEGDNNRINRTCVQMYGKAVFASCPTDLEMCTETLTLPANGGSISFNATVIYINGGSCGYQQDPSLVKLRRETNPIFSCKFNEDCYRYRSFEENLSFTRGDSGFEFMLLNATADSIGRYEVVLERVHPRTSALSTQTVVYHVVESIPESMPLLPASSNQSLSKSSPLAPAPNTASSTSIDTITNSSSTTSSQSSSPCPILTKTVTITTSPTVTNTTVTSLSPSPLSLPLSPTTKIISSSSTAVNTATTSSSRSSLSPSPSLLAPTKNDATVIFSPSLTSTTSGATSSPLSSSSPLTAAPTKSVNATTSSPWAATSVGPSKTYALPFAVVVIGVLTGVLVLLIVAFATIAVITAACCLRKKQVANRSSDKGSNSSQILTQTDQNRSMLYNTYKLDIRNDSTFSHALDSETSTGAFNVGDTTSINGVMELSDDQKNSKAEVV